MTSALRKYLNYPDYFLCVSGSFSVPSQKISINDFMKRAYVLSLLGSPCDVMTKVSGPRIEVR